MRSLINNPSTTITTMTTRAHHLRIVEWPGTSWDILPREAVLHPSPPHFTLDRYFRSQSRPSRSSVEETVDKRLLYNLLSAVTRVQHARCFRYNCQGKYESSFTSPPLQVQTPVVYGLIGLQLETGLTGHSALVVACFRPSQLRLMSIGFKTFLFL